MKRQLKNFVRLLLAVLILLGIGWMLHALAYRQWDRAAMLLVGLITAGIVWWQGGLIKDQIQFQSLIELDKEWNSEEMLKMRQTAFNKTSKQYEDFRLEGILEFLEKLASFKEAGVLDMGLLLRSNMGWYAVRYYFFNRESIPTFREKWKDERLYEDLESFYRQYLTLEVGHSDKKRKAYEKKLEDTRDDFIKNESRN